MDRLVDRWPHLASELRAALLDDDERALADSIDSLTVRKTCDCGDEFCQSFYTVEPSDGPWDSDRHRNVQLDAPWPGLLILDVVDEAITYVEVIDRPRPLD